MREHLFVGSPSKKPERTIGGIYATVTTEHTRPVKPPFLNADRVHDAETAFVCEGRWTPRLHWLEAYAALFVSKKTPLIR